MKREKYRFVVDNGPALSCAARRILDEIGIASRSELLAINTRGRDLQTHLLKFRGAGKKTVGEILSWSGYKPRDYKAEGTQRHIVRCVAFLKKNGYEVVKQIKP